MPALSDADVSTMKDEVQRAKRNMIIYNSFKLRPIENKVKFIEMAEESLAAAKEELEVAKLELAKLAYDLQGKIMNLINITGKGNISDYAEVFAQVGFEKLPIDDPVAPATPRQRSGRAGCRRRDIGFHCAALRRRCSNVSDTCGATNQSSAESSRTSSA